VARAAIKSPQIATPQDGPAASSHGRHRPCCRDTPLATRRARAQGRYAISCKSIHGWKSQRPPANPLLDRCAIDVNLPRPSHRGGDILTDSCRIGSRVKESVAKLRQLPIDPSG
jgi:hypothetical protein